MNDPRISQLARQLVRYSTAIKKGEKVLLHLADVPDALGVALIREVRARKGVPFLRIEHGQLGREMSIDATDEQFQTIAKHQLAEMKDMDAYIAVRGSHNICETSDVPAARMKTVMQHMRKPMNHRVAKTKWCVLRWPHPAMAQQAGMSTEAFENFYFDVCLLDYKKMLPAMNALKRLMEK
ncbi:MAG: aminopeptidase, partial [Akkermansiaceae bacterium]